MYAKYHIEYTCAAGGGAIRILDKLHTALAYVPRMVKYSLFITLVEHSAGKRRSNNFTRRTRLYRWHPGRQEWMKRS